MRRPDAWIEHQRSFSIEAVLESNLAVKRFPLRSSTRGRGSEVPPIRRIGVQCCVYQHLRWPIDVP